MLAFEWHVLMVGMLATRDYHTADVSTLRSIGFPVLRFNYQIWSLNLELQAKIHQDIVRVLLFRSIELFST